MKFLIVLAVALVSANAVTPYNKDEAEAPVVSNFYENSPEGSFQYKYETGNGIYAEANGVVKNFNSEYPSLEVQGGYKYIAPDGTPVELSYTAGEGGFKPVGSHIPVGPEIPEAIVRSLAFIAAHPPSDKPSSVAKPTYG